MATALTMLTAASNTAFGQNLIVNGDFDSSLAGWSDPTPFVEANWSGLLDAGGSPNSGSAFLENASEYEGYAGEISQCIPISPTGTYHIGGSVYLPDRQAVYGSVYLVITPYDAADCEGSEDSSRVVVGSSNTEGPTGQWLALELELDAAKLLDSSIHSGRFSLLVFKPGAPGSVGAYFDDIFMIAPEPGATLGGVAALFAVGLCARRRTKH